MGFLTPWFFAGLAGVGLPIWLHLLRKHRSTPTPFSSLMFFEQHIQSSIKHRRLRYLLLFALRTLLIALIVLAFAQPYVLRQVLPMTRSGEI
ncbi:MAG: BatA domain-containing protein, partial [Acidobacteria bacterium Pan2503]|nr:BatA domain-containing protein [Candidatus Acidoferrum panamensis]